MHKSLISPQELSTLLEENKNVILLDASPKSNVSGLQPQHPNKYIPNSIGADIKEFFVNTEGKYPNTIPSKARFENSCNQLRISNSDFIVIYDNLGIYSAPRVWTLFKHFGHDKVVVLNGGLDAWIEEGFETVESLTQPKPKTGYTVDSESNLIEEMDYILSKFEDPSIQIIDARSEARYNGSEPEPREGLSSGHIPGSGNIPFKNVLSDGRMKSKDELHEIFDSIDSQKEVIFSCGSGLTACILKLAYDQIGTQPSKIYDGSWTEWGSENPELIDKEN